MRRVFHSLVVMFAAASVLLAMSAGTAGAATVAFNHDISPPSTTSFDISWVDNPTGRYFLADRTNNAVDMINVKASDSATAFSSNGSGFVGQGVFAGNTGSRTSSGPNGVLTDSAGLVWAGDGNGTVKVLHATAGTGSAALIKSIATGGSKRSDELSYDPTDQVIVIANDFEGFLTFINVTSQSVLTHFCYADTTLTPTQQATLCPGGKAASLATAGGGLEQSVWDPTRHLFYQAVPANSPVTTGRLDAFKPDGTYVSSSSVPGCTNGPTGLAEGDFQRFLGACDNGGAVIQLPSGHVSEIVSNVGGADEVWFNPGDGNFYLGISDGSTGALGVVTRGPGNHFSGTLISGHGGHSVAAYAGNNHVYVPEKLGTGIAVYE